ncbi:MAG TPA: aminoglycoside phosphotransferase family protein, partial [Sorangium sp.]|nr:aminoglycoside phosphotransferase family protein [Sorangium sp.]
MYEHEDRCMELITLERGPSAAARSLTADQIVALCRRAFGERVVVTSAQEMGGGTFNTTYLVALDEQQVILRVAPPPGAALSWDEAALMRREIHIQPFFAALAARMPRTIAADFTHQLVDRDYMFQTFLPGERWDHVVDALSPEEAGALWEQFGRVTRIIHDTVGSAFGGPHPAPEFPSWSQAVLYRLERSLETMSELGLEVADMTAALDVVRAHKAVLDEIREPRLMHGDLWLFNLLIERGPPGASIVGVIDADRAFWGDPMADWTMFVLSKSASPDTRPLYDRFWQAYGRPAPTRASAFRAVVYEAMNVGIALPWA